MGKWLLNKNSLAGILGLLALVTAVEELPVEELDGDNSEDEVEQPVDHEDVEHILERVDDAVEDGLQLGDALDGLEGAEDAQHAEGLHRAEVLAARAATVNRAYRSHYILYVDSYTVRIPLLHTFV